MKQNITRNIVYIVWFSGKGFKNLDSIFFSYEKAKAYADEEQSKIASSKFHYRITAHYTTDTIEEVQEQ